MADWWLKLRGVGAGEERQNPALGESFSAKEAETSIRGNHSLTQTHKGS